MKQELTAERVRELLHYDPATGVFTWKVKTNKSRNSVGKVAGVADRKTGYVLVGIDYQHIRAHRLAWLYMTGSMPANEIDHINTNKSDNGWANLREATTQTNGQNKRKANKNSIVGLLGVSPHRGRYMARIKVDGKHKYLGTFDTPHDAHHAYVDAKRVMHVGGTL